MAVNWAVWPAASDWIDGVMVMVATWVLLPQPANMRVRPTSRNAPKQKRFNANFSFRRTSRGEARLGHQGPGIGVVVQVKGHRNSQLGA